MKTPIWEQSPGALVALLNASPTAFVYATLYTFTLQGSALTVRLCDADFDITDTTNVWDSRSVRVDQAASKGVGHWKRGLDVDQWLTVLLPRLVEPITGAAFPDKLNGTPWIEAARGGALDGADCFVDRAFFAAFPVPYQAVATPVGILRMFAGRMAEVDTGDTVVACTINDYRELLLIDIPRNLFQAGCRFTLYSAAGCTLNAATFLKTGAVLSSTNGSTINSNSPITPLGSGTFQLGKLTMTSGLNSGFSRTISQCAAGTTSIFNLLNPFPFTIAPGDTFNIFPGCDKSASSCALFGNSVNFGGMKDIPQAETAV